MQEAKHLLYIHCHDLEQLHILAKISSWSTQRVSQPRGGRLSSKTNEICKLN